MNCKWGDIITLEYGKPVPDKERLDGKYPVYGTNGQIGTSELPPLCNHPSFILGRKGAYRGVHYSHSPFSVIDTAFYVKTKTESLDLLWAYYKFLTYDINRMDSGSAIPSTDRHEIYSINVKLPSLPQQRTIAATLSCLDKKIELNNKINANLEAQAQAIFKSWFVDFEPFQDGEFVDSELGRIPKGWQVGKFGDIVTLSKTTEKFPNDKDVLYEHYSIPAYDDRRFPAFDHSSNIKSNKTIINNGCFLVSKLNPSFKRIWRPYCLTTNTVCSPEFMAIKPLNTAWSAFCYSIADSVQFYDFLNQHTTGSTGSRQRVSPQTALELPVIIPEEKHIVDFCLIADGIYKKIDSLSVQNQTLATIRDTLLPMLMSGEIEVPENE